jgi:ferredoxin
MKLERYEEIIVRFLPDGVETIARSSETILGVAKRVGVTIDTGCLRGSCGACEVELDTGEVARSCITTIPNSTPTCTIELYCDNIW